jgi:hypothetical protein
MIETQGERDDSRRRDGPTIQAETILPVQFHASGFTAHLQPEKRLMLAVLEDAVTAYQRYAISTEQDERADFVEVLRWFNAADQRWPFSFRNICEALGLEADRLRRGLAAWRELRRAGLVTAVTTTPFRRMSGSRHRTGGATGLRNMKRVA